MNKTENNSTKTKKINAHFKKQLKLNLTKVKLNRHLK